MIVPKTLHIIIRSYYLIMTFVDIGAKCKQSPWTRSCWNGIHKRNVFLVFGNVSKSVFTSSNSCDICSTFIYSAGSRTSQKSLPPLASGPHGTPPIQTQPSVSGYEDEEENAGLSAFVQVYTPGGGWEGGTYHHWHQGLMALRP